MRFLLEGLNKNIPFLFFDESSIANSNFKSKAWLPTGKKRVLPMKSSFKPVKILACMDKYQIISLQFYQKCNGITIRDFLDKTLDYYISYYHFDNVVLLMDNAPMNRIQEVKNLANKYPIYLLYNAVSTPQLNIIEHFFEYLKRDLRRSYFQDDYTSLKSLIKKAQTYNVSNIQKSFQKEIENYRKILKLDDLFI